MLEALFAAATEAVFSYILDTLEPAERLRDWLGRDPAKLAYQHALARTYAAFARQYPELTASLFNESFLTIEAAPELAKFLTRHQHLDHTELVRLWAKSIAPQTEAGQQSVEALSKREDLNTASAYFVELLTSELKHESALQPLFDSRALESLPAIEVKLDQLMDAWQRALTIAMHYEQTLVNRSGGVDFQAQEVTIGGDVVGRDKILSASGHIIQAAEGATVIIGERPAPEPRNFSPAPGEPPFKGLHYFDEVDAELFFGREKLTEQLATRLCDEVFLAIVGASGSGKSSLVRAGLLPMLRREHPRWQIHLITPTAHPIKELAASLTRAAESITATTTLIDDLERDARSLDLAAAKVLKQSNHGERLLLIVDQFEELFTACKDEREQHAFVDNVMHAVAPDTNGPVTVVITLRADFYAHCAGFDLLRQALMQHQAYIGPMSTSELHCAIEEPAQRAGWHFQPGLIDLMLHDVGDEPGALPLLSHALLATWQQRRGRVLTLEGYHESGGVHGAIAKTAESVLNHLEQEQQTIARNVFLAVTEFGEGIQDTRRRVTIVELMASSQEAPLITIVLKVLADARLIITDRDVVEIAHEALIREWPRLREWLAENREDLRVHRGLTKTIQEWLTLNRDPGVLLRGAVLARAEAWAETHANKLNPLEQEFLEASKELAKLEAEESELRDTLLRYASELEVRVVERTAEIENERRRLAAILDTAGEGIIFTSLDGTIEYVNPEMERLTGYAVSESLGRTPRLWRSGQTPNTLYEQMWHRIKNGQVWQGQLINCRKDGTLYDASLIITPLRDASGQISGFVAVQRDVTSQRELDRLKDSFVSNVSHELRTPVANFKLYLSLLERGRPEKYEQYLKTLKRESDRLEYLIEDLLDISRLDISGVAIRPTDTDLNRLTEELIADRLGLAVGRGLQLLCFSSADLPPVQADSTLLAQAISNLITNALNYTPPGGTIRVNTAIHVQEQREWITWTIEDTGPGISEKDMRHLFERFYRGEAGRKSDAPGTGLGLAICHEIINKMGGHITVESQPGKGAAFTIWLNRAKEDTSSAESEAV